MGRYGRGYSYGHHIKVTSLPHGEYRLSWTVDRYYRTSRQRHPRSCYRDTDYAGAVRFAKRWKLSLPPAPEAP